MDPSNCSAFDGFDKGDLVCVNNLRPQKPLHGQAQAKIDYWTNVTKNPTKTYIVSEFQKMLRDLPLSMNDYLLDLNDKVETWEIEVLQGS